MNDMAPSGNHLLSVIDELAGGRLRAAAERVSLRVGQILHEPGVASAHVHFPSTALVSLMYTMENGDSVESAVVGNDGFVSVAAVMGGDSMPLSAVVQATGSAFRLRTAQLQAEATQSPPLQRYLLRYAQNLLMQSSQIAACNRLHTLDRQFCRRLLQGLDRVTGNELMMTHEAVGYILGVRRESVTLAATRLQDAGIIRYSRGRIRILDRARLEAEACECYGVVRDESRRLLMPSTVPGCSVLLRTDAPPRHAHAHTRNGHEQRLSIALDAGCRHGGDRRRAERRLNAERRRRLIATAFRNRRALDRRR